MNIVHARVRNAKQASSVLHSNTDHVRKKLVDVVLLFFLLLLCELGCFGMYRDAVLLTQR